MATTSEPKIEPPECSLCGIEMEFKRGGTETSVPIIGSEVEFQQFACPECGQGARYERYSADEPWERAGE